MFKREKKEGKKLKSVEKILEWMNQSPQYNQNGQSQRDAKKGNVFTRTCWKLANDMYFKRLVPHLYNKLCLRLVKLRSKMKKKNTSK